MPSIIPGFEYDIFVSYRQKDNKGGHWVTDFVEALRNELESTFKEDISIYFDENPHDGLHETHDVDESLKEKLKCLIFIPIISRTYCDPKSFAWQHEFVPFVGLASNDSFGLKVKLRGGNVASRIIPIRIHDLDKNDITLFESVVGTMRPVDFVFKTTGVNRPLMLNEPHPNENQSHINYRDQINKLANAIKDVIEGLLQKGGTSTFPDTNAMAHKAISNEYSVRSATSKRGIIMVISLIVLAVLTYFIFHSFKRGAPGEVPGKSIAILPFQNLSGDEKQEYFSDGVAEEILNALSKIKDLKVVGRSSSFRFKGNAVDIQEVGEKLKVSAILEGSIRRQGNDVKVSARLLNVSDGYQLWAEQFEGTLSDMFKIQEEIAVAISDRLKVTLLQSESLKLGEGLTQNAAAYDALLKGRFYWDKRNLEQAEQFFKEAIALDPNFAAAYVGLSETYVISPFFRIGFANEKMPKAELAAEKAIQLDSSLTTPYFVIGFKKAIYDRNVDQARAYFKKALQGNSKYAQGYYWYGQYLYCFESEYEHSVEVMRKAVEIEPLGSFAYLNLGNGLFWAKRYEEALDACRFSSELNSLNPITPVLTGFCNISLGRFEEAEKFFEKATSMNNDWGRAFLVFFYMKKGKESEAQKLYDDITSPSRKGNASQTALATAAAFLGKKDLAHEHLKKAIEERDTWMPYMLTPPFQLPNDVLSDPRNMALLKQHFPHYKGRREGIPRY